MTGAGPLVVLGLPCSGKTTLADRLAAALGRRHISVGELIRSARAADEAFRDRSERAYLGHADFEPEDLARLVAERLSRDGVGPGDVVLDAGPPMDRVAERLGWTGVGTLVVLVDDATAAARLLYRRRSTGGRVDDIAGVFQDRLERYRRRLPDVVAGLSGLGWTAPVSGTTDPRGVLRQALSAVELHTVLWRRRAASSDEVTAGFLRTAVATLGGAAAAAGDPVDIVLADRHDAGAGHGNAMVLLCKPATRLAPTALHAVDVAAQRFGYHVTRVSATPGGAVARTSVANAHFDLHSQISRWGSGLATVLDPRIAAEAAAGGTVLGGHEYLRAFGADALDEAWREDSDRPPRPVGGRFWSLTPPFPGDVLLLNGHMPAVLAEYEHPDSVVYAALLSPVAPDAGRRGATWSTMRREFLGHTDPARAADGSLRARAVAPDLLTQGRGSFRNNVFHLSRGPLEALREAGVWFGTDVLAEVADRGSLAPPGVEPATLAVDRPVSAAAFPAWAFELTATVDAGSDTVREVVGAMLRR